MTRTKAVTATGGEVLSRIAGVVLLLALVLCCACARSKEADAPRDLARPNEVPEHPGSSTQDLRPVIVAFGDSLTAGLGVGPEENYPARLQAKIDAEGYRYRVINAGVSGDTSSQGLDRLEAIRTLHPAIVIIEFGGNDGLRGVPVDATRQNLEAIVSGLQDVGSKVVMAGMQMPPNYGPEYTKSFHKIFADVAAERHTALVPFLLERVGGHAELNQGDGIHPTAKGYGIVVENVWKALVPLLRKP